MPKMTAQQLHIGPIGNIQQISDILKFICSVDYTAQIALLKSVKPWVILAFLCIFVRY